MMVVRHPVSLLMLLLVAPLGCADRPDNERSAIAAIDTFVPHQGRLLLGFKNPDVRVFSFANSLPTTRVINGELVAGSTSGKNFTGVTFTGAFGGPAIDMRISQVIPPDANEPRWQYVLEQRLPNTTEWEPACDAPIELFPPAEPPPNPPRAIAMPGLWFGPFYWVHADYVTFACKTGVAAKCDGWGFPVIKQWPNLTKNGLPTTASGADMMQACSRMARADYCGSGMPNTLDGTPIQIDTTFTGVQDYEGFAFEAAWPGKAINDSQPVALPVVCLSRRRWSTLPLGGDCSVQVPDPRINDKARFCDDIPLIELERAGALVYSSSTYIDAGLYTYFDDESGAQLTTASLLPQAVGKVPEWQIPAPAGVDFPRPGQRTQFEATIYPASLPAQIPDTELIKLFSYRCGSDFITTTADMSDQDCAQIAHEGYVYQRNAPGRAPLRRWSSTTTGHSYTTAAAPSTMVAAGWNMVEVMGGVLRAAINVNVRWSSISGYKYALDVQTRAGGWIAPCVTSGQIGSTPSFVYRGLCPGSANYPLNHADIIAFRVTYTRPGFPTYVATQAYDGFASDAYVELEAPTSATTALAMRWNDAGSENTYAVDVRKAGEDWIRCADPKLLANDVSYVHAGRCMTVGTNVLVSKIVQIRVCTFDRKGQTELGCSEPIDYDGRTPSVEIKVKIKSKS